MHEIDENIEFLSFVSELAQRTEKKQTYLLSQGKCHGDQIRIPRPLTNVARDVSRPRRAWSVFETS